jgi:hypothetical protein
MTVRQFILPAALLVATAAFSPALAQDGQAAAPAPAAEAAPAATGKVPPPPAGKGQVVFFRPSNMMGMALSFSVHEGDEGIAKLGNGSYSVFVTDPGTHLFTIQGEVTDKLTLEIEPGETYYVKQTIGVGVVAGRPRLTPAEQGEFDRLKLKVSTKKPTDKASKADKSDD